VYRTAVKNQITGTVKNDGRGVLVEASGSEDNLNRFIEGLRSNTPPLAAIREFTVEELSASDPFESFSIVESREGDVLEVDAARDTAVCENCLREMRDPKDRRYRHPFINCTNCGPRYTIIRKLPYDRPSTTMGQFTMCPRCKAEYTEPENRRFHAQPVCCPECGPVLKLHDAGGTVL
jgi:hydrogenase maturation protein HypF